METCAPKEEKHEDDFSLPPPNKQRCKSQPTYCGDDSFYDIPEEAKPALRVELNEWLTKLFVAKRTLTVTTVFANIRDHAPESIRVFAAFAPTHSVATSEAGKCLLQWVKDGKAVLRTGSYGPLTTRFNVAITVDTHDLTSRPVKPPPRRSAMAPPKADVPVHVAVPMTVVASLNMPLHGFSFAFPAPPSPSPSPSRPSESLIRSTQKRAREDNKKRQAKRPKVAGRRFARRAIDCGECGNAVLAAVKRITSQPTIDEDANIEFFLGSLFCELYDDGFIDAATRHHLTATAYEHSTTDDGVKLWTCILGAPSFELLGSVLSAEFTRV
jgi:hypothetical protein